MNKVKLDIPRKEDGKWGSYISKYPSDSAKVPVNAMTINTRNVITSATGMAEKRLGGAIWNPNSALSGATLDQYEGIFVSGERIMLVNDAGTLKGSAGNGTFTPIQAGYTNPANFEFATYQGRVYGCNGVNDPVVIDTVTTYGGVPYVFSLAKTRTMGPTAPASAPTATRNTDSTASQVPAGSHRYKVTFVYYSGVEESNGGTASAVCVNDATHTSNGLTAIPVGGYGVTARNIYRDDNDGDYRLLATISNNTATTYTDVLPVGSTPTPIPTTNDAPPVFKYIALYLDRLFIIDITGKTIAWSNAGEPDVFDPANVISGPQDDVMTAIYIFNGIPYVFGQHTVGTIQGTTDGTFYYSQLSQSVGCVDNRTIQTRSIVSVPTLLWLAATPNKGIYYTNGSVVQYLSDFIEDLTFNLAQVSYLERSNTQNSEAAFESGTASTSIDLTSNPGTLQTIDPKAEYSHAADWATGTSSNVAIVGDSLAVPTRFAPSASDGARTGDAIVSGNSVTLQTATGFTGESHLDGNTFLGSGAYSAGAQLVSPPVTGNITRISYRFFTAPIAGISYVLRIWEDSGGLPGSVLFTSSTFVTTSVAQTVTATCSVGGASRYWIGLEKTGGSDNLLICGFNSSSVWGGGNLMAANNGSWHTAPTSINGTQNGLAVAYTYDHSAVTATGTWTSPSYDSLSTSLSAGMAFVTSGSYPSGTSASVAIQGSANLSSWTTTDTLSSPNGTTSITGGVYRYWRVVMTLTSTDNRVAPTLGDNFLTYATTATWTSAAILLTTDCTALNACPINTVTPAGTTVTITVATSASIGSGYSAFTDISLATPNKYAKIRVTMTATTDDTTSPTIFTAELDWTVVGNLVSVAIDTAVAPPAGWGIFQYNQVGSSGIAAFYFRSAASSGALPGAAWTAVGNGSYPTATALEWCQWKAVMTATADSLPEVNSVTVHWLLTSGTNVRAASLFFNKSYYLSVATTGSTSNNLLIELDYEGNWRVHDGVSIGTMALYFNDAFYGSGTTGSIYNAFKLPTDNGTNISFDLRTKCFDLGDNEKLKSIRSCRVTGVNTGTTIHVYYSVDRGTTWIEMLNSSGTLGYTTSMDDSQFVEYFICDYDGDAATSGRNVIFRVTSTDALPCQIEQITPELYGHKGKAITEAMQ